MRFCKLLFTAVALMSIHAGSLAQSQFYLFPVAVLEGISDGSINPVLRKGIVDALKDEATRPDVAIIRRFEAAVRRTFPQSTVHASQIGPTAIGTSPQYIADGPRCNSAFMVPVTSSYAVVLSVTRASEYRNEHAGQVDIQIPITLTLQIIKPDRGRVAYTLSDTLYSPFILSKQEAGMPASTSLIRRKVIENLMGQVDYLVAEAGKAFNPKSSVVNVMGKSGKYLVLDGGYEIGFSKGEELSATQADKLSTEVLFKVIAANSGHSIVRLLQGEVNVGTGLNFVFESTADDSAKPMLTASPSKSLYEATL